MIAWGLTEASDPLSWPIDVFPYAYGGIQAVRNIRTFVRFFQAMSDPTRQKILLLLEGKELCVGDLVKHFKLAQPTISKHLSVLRNAGLVQSRRQGQQVFYGLCCNSLRGTSESYFANFQCCADLFPEAKGRRAHAGKAAGLELEPGGES